MIFGFASFFLYPAVSYVFHGLDFSGSIFFMVQFSLCPGFPGPRSRVWVQVLEVVLFIIPKSNMPMLSSGNSEVYILFQ